MRMRLHMGAGERGGPMAQWTSETLAEKVRGHTVPNRFRETVRRMPDAVSSSSAAVRLPDQ